MLLFQSSALQACGFESHYHIILLKMLLVYVDEAGVNYKIDTSTGFFHDGSHLVWCGVLVNEEKYFHLERLIYNLAYRFLKIKDWKAVELHANDIWARRGVFSHLTNENVREYFEELFQLLAKLKINVVIGIQQKTRSFKSSTAINKEKEICVKALFIALEHQLSELNQTAIVIADDESGSNEERILNNILYEQTKWRYNPGAKQNAKYQYKYKYEASSCFILDQLHYVDSKDSLFMQITDHITFVLKRVITYGYLNNYNRTFKSFPKADITKVPVTSNTFNVFVRNAKCSFLSEDDFTITDFTNNTDDNHYFKGHFLRSISPNENK